MRSWLAWPGAPMAMASAALFGASTPLAKLLLGEGITPFLLAGLLYMGSGLGLACLSLPLRLMKGQRHEAPLRGSDWGWLALVVLAGGVAAPLLLMVGLQSTPATTTALLLNLEGLATMGIAWAVFRENVDRRLLLGALAIAGACLFWGIDNNLTRQISGSDPIQIAMVKGIGAGITNIGLGWALGAHVPPLHAVLAAALVGLLGYGVSLVLFVLGLRHLGTARTGAYFSTAPFIGAMLSVAIFGEPMTVKLLVVAALMGIGLWLHLAERHDHDHVHEPMEHSHAHSHDAHHRHDHGPADPPDEPHVHRHSHARLIHAHPHYPDLHHRHDHHDHHDHAAPAAEDH